MVSLKHKSTCDCLHMFVFLISGVSIAMFSNSNLVRSTAVAFIISPMTSIIDSSCLTFRYFLRSNMKFSITNSRKTKLMTDFYVDGGFDFHQAFIDLPRGRYQFIWEVQLETSDPVEVVKSYRAAVDDVDVAMMTCAQLRKFQQIQIFRMVDNKNLSIQC